MPAAGAFFANPDDDDLIPLSVQPRLASWMATDHPDQIRLEEFLAHAADTVRPRLATLAGPVTLRLDVGLPPTVDLLDGHDLDNYAFPLVGRLRKISEHEIVSVWCSKQHHPTSHIGVAQATHADEGTIPGRRLHVRTTASATSVAYKRQIHEQLAGESVLPAGPISLQLSFTVGTRRSWPNLWKATIDSLEPLLGRTRPSETWHPLDGRIVELGLHCQPDATLGNDVILALAARTITGAVRGG